MLEPCRYKLFKLKSRLWSSNVTLPILRGRESSTIVLVSRRSSRRWCCNDRKMPRTSVPWDMSRRKPSRWSLATYYSFCDSFAAICTLYSRLSCCCLFCFFFFYEIKYPYSLGTIVLPSLYNYIRVAETIIVMKIVYLHLNGRVTNLI